MALVKITAIIRRDALEATEARLKQVGVPGITVSTVKGFGEYANFFSHDWMVTHARIEIFADENDADRMVNAIQETANSGAEGDGIIAVLPVKRLIRIRTGEQSIAQAAPHSTTTQHEAVFPQNGHNSTTALLMAWLIVVTGILAAISVVFVTSRHQMHFLAAVLGVVFVLCSVLGALTVARQWR